MSGKHILQDEEYLIERARTASDKLLAESWILTAKTLIPTSFAIQYETYSMCKEKQCGMESGCYLQEMLSKFPTEPTLWQEVLSITSALKSENHSLDTGGKQLKSIFLQLTVKAQHDMLLAVAQHCSADTAEHCKLMLLLLRLFPHSIEDHGLKLIETLLAAERDIPVALNKFKKLLVCDVLPLVFASTLKLPYRMTVKLLEESLVFYVCYINSTTKCFDICSDSKELWANFFHVAYLASKKLNWELADLLSNGSISESQLSRLNSMAGMGAVDLSKSSKADSAADRTQVFYITFIVFVHSLFFYGSYTLPTDTSPGCILVDLREKTQDCTTSALNKKIKLEQRPTQLSVSRAIPADVGKSLVSHFVTAAKCLDVLRMQKTEMDRMSLLLEMDKWSCLNAFFIDALLYQNMYDDAITMLCTISAALTDPFSKLKASLQLASCFFSVANRDTALIKVLDVISNLPVEKSFTSSSAPRNCTQPLNMHFTDIDKDLGFIVFSRREILKFCIRLVMSCLKEKISEQRDDLALGHLFVLCQFEWPIYEEQFHILLEFVKKAQSFNYPLFMSYVVVPEILEEFMYLASTPPTELEASRLQLDLLPNSGQSSRSRTVTRGVNKGAKEDLRAAMEKQMTRAAEDVGQIIVQFLLTEKKLLIDKCS